MIYLDTAAIIRLIEGTPELIHRVESEITSFQICTSVISISECLSKPIRETNKPLIDFYDQWFQTEDLQLIPVSSEIARTAAACRAEFGLKTADAIHLASAAQVGATVILTSDNRFPRANGFHGVTIKLIPAN